MQYFNYFILFFMNKIKEKVKIKYQNKMRYIILHNLYNLYN